MHTAATLGTYCSGIKCTQLKCSIWNVLPAFGRWLTRIHGVPASYNVLPTLGRSPSFTVSTIASLPSALKSHCSLNSWQLSNLVCLFLCYCCSHNLFSYVVYITCSHCCWTVCSLLLPNRFLLNHAKKSAEFWHNSATVTFHRVLFVRVEEGTVEAAANCKKQKQCAYATSFYHSDQKLRYAMACRGGVGWGGGLCLFTRYWVDCEDRGGGGDPLRERERERAVYPPQHRAWDLDLWNCQTHTEIERERRGMGCWNTRPNSGKLKLRLQAVHTTAAHTHSVH